MTSHPVNAYEPRWYYSREHFLAESKAYHQLQKSEVTCVPQCYGKYILKFPEREHERDRTVYVMIFECIKGKLLSEVEGLRIWKNEDKEKLLRKCCDGSREILAAGVWHRVPKPCKIILQKNSKNIRWFDFSRSEILTAEDVQNGRAQCLAESDVAKIRESLESIM